jgi:hypothetical protein
MICGRHGWCFAFELESATCPTPLSKVTDVALVELQISVVDEPRMIEVGCAVEQAVKVTASSRVATRLNIYPKHNSG